MDPSRLAFNHVAVAGTPPVEFCLDPHAGDPVATWLLEHDSLDEPVMLASLGLVGPGTRVIDLGCRLGTFSLPAAALGAEVLAVDASARHVHLLRMAARRNGFDSLHVIHGTVGDIGRSAALVESGHHGRVRPPEPADSSAAMIPMTSVDELIERRKWEAVDVIKLDIGGSEPAALRGMHRLHARGLRPAMVVACNGHLLPLLGTSTRELRATIEELGYELLLIDRLRPGTLVEGGADSVQPECVADYLALVSRSQRLERDWSIEPPFGREQIVTRLLHAAASEDPVHRGYAADLFAVEPDWLGPQPTMPAGQTAPVPAGMSSDTLVLATDVCANARRDEPERWGVADVGIPTLRDLSFHLRAGESVAVLVDDPEAGSALVRLIGRLEVPVAGELAVRGHVTVVSQLAEVFEPDLEIGENLMLFGAFLGCDVRAISLRLVELASRAGVGHLLGSPLMRLTPDVETRLALTVAVECATRPVLVLDRLPIVEDVGFRRWFGERVGQLRHTGTAVVQVVRNPDELLAAADRIVWLKPAREQAQSRHSTPVIFDNGSTNRTARAAT
jgi:FkbM family methyltransferase